MAINDGGRMTFHEFSKINRARCESPEGFKHRLIDWSLSDWITAITGELGEAANIVKKLNRIRDGIPGNKESLFELGVKLKREMADTFIYLDLAAQAAGFELGDVVMEVFDAKSAEIGYVAERRTTTPLTGGSHAEEVAEGQGKRLQDLPR